MYQYYPKKRHHFFTYPLVGIICFIFGWQATSYGLITKGVTPEDGTDAEQSGELDDSSKKLSEKIDLDLFWTVWGEVDKSYVDEESLDDDKMTYGAIKGMVNSLEDPYTVFMDPKESKEFAESLEGTLEGIGAELSVEDQSLVIVSPLRDSPAEKAGLLPGDIIFKIDGNLASDMGLFQAISSIRGTKGTSVKLTIIRNKVEDPFDVTIVRDSISIDSVTSEKLANGIVYISVNQFNDKTSSEFNKVVSDLVLNPPKGLIVDLRYNGGGYLDIAVDLLSYLLPSKSKAVEIRQRGKENEILETNGNPKLLETPLVVLVNEGSASASEIVAGAIQDLKRGVIMGTKTFGKGSVQEVESFKDGSSMRLTIAKWYTPAGRNVHKIGLNPDVVVEMKDADVAKEIDTQKQAAINYLLNLRK